MAFVFLIVGGLGGLVVVQKKGVVGVGEHYVLPQKGFLQELVIVVDLLKEVVIALDEAELVVAFGGALIIKIQSVLSQKHIIGPQFIDQFADVLQILFIDFVDTF